MQPASVRDQRAKWRFDLDLEVSFKAATGAGSGRTLNLGSGGVAFVTDHPLRIREQVEVSIQWPALLDQNCPLKLLIFGRVLRAENPKFVVTIDRYEFRTQARTLRSDPEQNAKIAIQALGRELRGYQALGQF